MTRAFRQHMYPDSPLSCPLCNQGGELRPPFLPMLPSAGVMAFGCCGTSRYYIGRGILVFGDGRFLQAGG